MNYEGGTGTPNDVQLQQHIYDFFGTDLAKRYWVQRNGTVLTCPLLTHLVPLTAVLARHSWRGPRQTYTPPTLQPPPPRPDHTP